MDSGGQLVPIAISFGSAGMFGVVSLATANFVFAMIAIALVIFAVTMLIIVSTNNS